MVSLKERASAIYSVRGNACRSSTIARRGIKLGRKRQLLCGFHLLGWLWEGRVFPKPRRGVRFAHGLVVPRAWELESECVMGDSVAL